MFIATREASVTDEYRDMLIAANSSDIFYTAALDGAPANWLTPSLVQAGLDPSKIGRMAEGDIISADEVKGRYKNIWSAGHGVGGIYDVLPAVDLCDRLKTEYETARAEMSARLA